MNYCMFLSIRQVCGDDGECRCPNSSGLCGVGKLHATSQSKCIQTLLHTPERPTHNTHNIQCRRFAATLIPFCGRPDCLDVEVDRPLPGKGTYPACGLAFPGQDMPPALNRSEPMAPSLFSDTTGLPECTRQNTGCTYLF